MTSEFKTDQSKTSVKFKSDADSNANTGSRGSVDENGFIERQKRRISEHPTISRIQLARTTSKHRVTYLGKVLAIIASSWPFKILLAIMYFIPFSKIVVYGFFYKQCPVEPIIPLYLLIGGLQSCFRDIASLFTRRCFSKECLKEWEISLTLLAVVYTLAEFIWFIVGSVYVYQTYGIYQGADPDKSDYCSSVLYIYAFVVTTLSYVLLFIVIFLSCCAICLANLSSDKSSSNRQPKVVHQTISDA